MTNTLNGIDLGKIQGWRNAKQGNILPISTPGSDSEGSQAVDLLGMIEFFDIQGRMTGTFDQVQSALLSLKQLADGNQSVSVNLVSPYVITNSIAGSQSSPATISVKVQDVDYTWEIPGLSYADYTLRLVVGG